MRNSLALGYVSLMYQLQPLSHPLDVTLVYTYRNSVRIIVIRVRNIYYHHNKQFFLEMLRLGVGSNSLINCLDQMFARIG